MSKTFAPNMSEKMTEAHNKKKKGNARHCCPTKPPTPTLTQQLGYVNNLADGEGFEPRTACVAVGGAIRTFAVQNSWGACM